MLAINLIPNAGFEWKELLENEYPFGHERSVYLYDDKRYRNLSIVERYGKQTQVAGIRGATENVEASFTPAPILIAPGTSYLHFVFAKLLEGRGQMAVSWRYSDIIHKFSGNYVGFGREKDWKLIPQLVSAPDEAYYADAFIGIQKSTIDKIYFDNHTLITIPNLPCE